MRVFHQYGSKEKLFEMLHKVNGIVLKESLLPKEKRIEIIKELINFVKKKLNLNDDNMPKIIVSYDDGEAKKMKSFGKNIPEIKEIRVVDKNRNLADTCRTIAHEIKHTEQYIKGKLTSDSGNDGSEIENEASAFASIVMREFGKKHPDIFE